MFSKYAYVAGVLTGLIISYIYVQPITDLNYFMPYIGKTLKNVNMNLEQINLSNNVALDLQEKIKILCLVLTKPSNHKTRAYAVKNTWGARCSKILFVSTKVDESLDTIIVNVTENRKHLWGKTKAAFKHAYEKYLNEYDWFLKADDDT